MSIKAYSGGIGSLPLPEIKLAANIADGDILVWDASRKILCSTVSADKATGKLYVTGASSAGGVSLVKNTADRDINLLGLKAGNLIQLTPSVDGNSLVINVNANVQNLLGGSDGFTGELKTSQIVVAGAGLVHDYGFLSENTGQELEVNPNYTIVYRNGRRVSPSEYLFTELNTITFYDALEGDELHIDTITNEIDTQLVHSKRVMAAAGDQSYQFLDQFNNLININRFFLEVFVNRIKVHQRDYVVQENQVIFAEGSIVEQDEIEIITLGDI